MYYRRRKKKKHVDTKSLVDEYLKNGGTITKKDAIKPIDYFVEYRFSDAFYKTDEWKSARNKFLSDVYHKNEGKYMCTYCEHPLYFGEQEHEGNLLLVDHIKPVRKFWNERLNPKNFTISCGKCNELKCNKVFGVDIEFEAFVKIAKEKRKLYNKEISITDDKAWYYLDPQN